MKRVELSNERRGGSEGGDGVGFEMFDGARAKCISHGFGHKA